MTFKGLDKDKLTWLLGMGTDESELRRFFNDSRAQLIMKGGRVQNLPSGNVARVKMIVQGLPAATDPIVQRWFSENLQMSDPVQADSLVETLREYEEADEPLPNESARRYARSCLVYLFSDHPSDDLLTFLRPSRAETSEAALDANTITSQPESHPQDSWDDVSFSEALVALAEGKDPDAHLAKLPPAVATIIACVHAVRSGLSDEVTNTLASLKSESGVYAVLDAHKNRRAAEIHSKASGGLQVNQFKHPEAPILFDQKIDEIFGICTKDYPENAVFVRPHAIRNTNGDFISLARLEDRKTLFPDSGDVMAFAGPKYPRQPKLWEVGLWRVKENPVIRANLTNFHLDSERIPLFEVYRVNFKSVQYDSVRDYIKQNIATASQSDAKQRLFLLSDGLIVGCPAGKDLTRDEGFEAGLPAWRSLHAIEFEGRILVPGPLPTPETYECEPLSFSVRKLAASLKGAASRPTHAQMKQLQEAIATGEVRLNAERAARLAEELSFIEQHEGAVEAVVEHLRSDQRVKDRIEFLVQAEVTAQLAKKEGLKEEIAKLEKDRMVGKEKLDAQLKEQRAIAPGVAKAIRAAFVGAQAEGVKTLAQATVLKALMEAVAPAPATEVTKHPEASTTAYPTLKLRSLARSDTPVNESLKSLGVHPRFAKALEVVGRVAFKSGLMLVVDGVASRIVAESWAQASGIPVVLDCPIGLIDDAQIRDHLHDSVESFCILDANLSPVDVYARTLIDSVQRRIALEQLHEGAGGVLLSMSDGIAALALPRVVRAVSLRVSLDVRPEFLSTEKAQMRLDEMTDQDGDTGWAHDLWRPAADRVLQLLRAMGEDEMALAISVLDASSVRG